MADTHVEGESESRTPDASGYTREAWEFMREHPGGLDREFFAEILPTFAAEYGERRSLEPGEGEIEVLLSSGETFCIAGVCVGLTFVVLLTHDDEMVATPLRTILRVTIRQRATKAPAKKAPLGFSVEVIHETTQPQFCGRWISDSLPSSIAQLANVCRQS